MRFKPKLLAGAAVGLLAVGGAGAGLAASGHAGSRHVIRSVRLESTTRRAFIRASAEYLGIDTATLRREVRGGRTLADVADSTPGRSASRLAALLEAAAAVRLEVVAGGSLPPRQQRVLHSLLRRRIAGFLDDTCPLGLTGLDKHLGGCPGMSM